MTHEQEIVWLADLLEGEGCFYWRQSNERYGAAYGIALGMTDEDVVKRAPRIMCNARVHPKKSAHLQRKQVFRIAIIGTKAISLMKQVLPFMGVRRSAKIEEILSAYDRRVTRSQAQLKRRRDKNTAELFVVNAS